ncbi:MAG: hypothetical protein LBC63_03680 [Holophagales bacterium]|jgi:modification methylase|nr:hypothetical protein [Holophagales bacterium]
MTQKYQTKANTIPTTAITEPGISRKRKLNGKSVRKSLQQFEPNLVQNDTDDINQFRNKFICGDSLEVMATIPSGSVDLVVTSPPYNLKNSTGNGMKDGRGGKWANASLINGYSHHHDCMPHDEYSKWQRQCLTEMYRVIKDDGAIFYNHKWRVQAGLLQDRRDIVADFPIRQIIIWKRKGNYILDSTS